MQRQILTRSFSVALAALLALALPASTVEPGEIDTDSPLVDILMSDGMTREEMVGLYEALAGGDFEPPPCVPGEEMFDDVPASSIFCPWIEELARSGITSGCDADNYCPGDPVSRAQMAIFIVKQLRRGALVKLTTLSGRFDGSTSEQTIYEEIAEIGEFTKERPDTAIKLTWTGNVRFVGTGTTNCRFQPRIDGNNALGPGNNDTTAPGQAIIYPPTREGTETVTVFFEGLAAGSHSVSLWARSLNAEACIVSRFTSTHQHVYIEEIAI